MMGQMRQASKQERMMFSIIAYVYENGVEEEEKEDYEIARKELLAHIEETGGFLTDDEIYGYSDDEHDIIQAVENEAAIEEM